VNTGYLDERVNAAQSRLGLLRQHVAAVAAPDLLSEVVEEISLNIEELHVALEELHQQNAELAAARHAVELERQRYQSLFEYAPSGYLVTDPEGVVRESNQEIAAILHVRQSFLVGKPLIVFVGENDRRALSELLARLKGGADTCKWECALQNRKGETVPAIVHVTADRGRSGAIADLRWLILDISEQKQVQEALRASEERYRGLFENAHFVVFTLDAEGNFTSLNRAGERVSGYTREEALKLNFVDLVAPEFSDDARFMIAGRPEGRPAVGAVEIFAKDGRRVTLEVSVRRVSDKGRPAGLEVFARDQTEHKLLEEELRQSQKMEAIGRLGGGIAHDFNNLLTAIVGFGNLLKTELSPGSLAELHVAEIIRAAERAEMLTRQLLAFSRKQMLEPRVVDLNLIVEGMGQMLSRVIGEDIEIVTKLRSDVERVKVDLLSIEQVILNLVVNARDAMPQGGTITIETSGFEVSGSRLAESLGLAPGAYVRLQISDTGCGMEPETLAHIFEPFFTTKEVGKGTGLGLSSAYGTVKQSNGHLCAASEPGKGSTFSVYLPAHGPVEAHTENIPALSPVKSGFEVILLVEDDEVIRSLVRDVLADSGYTVLVASSGAEAITVSNNRPGPINLLLTDVVMPSMSGPESATVLLTARPEMKLLYISGHSSDTITQHGVPGSSAQLLKKPFTPESLSRKVRDVLDS
jgi:two-component system, cell cycle sensor histidine kinase and response regulator CckA